MDYQALLSARNGELGQPIKEVWPCNTNRGVKEVSDEAEGAAVLQMTNNALSEMLESLEVRE